MVRKDRFRESVRRVSSITVRAVATCLPGKCVEVPWSTDSSGGAICSHCIRGHGPKDREITYRSSPSSSEALVGSTLYRASTRHHQRWRSVGHMFVAVWLGSLGGIAKLADRLDSWP